ncbi:MAG: hypothetical protein ACYCU0_12410 [Solirubrobacteraceae bacterium]
MDAKYDGPPNSVRAYSQGGREIYLWNPPQSEMSPSIVNEGGGEICILRVTAVMSRTSCGDAQKVAEEGVVSAVSNEKKVTIEALVPDSVLSVTITYAGGASRPVQVSDNLAVVEPAAGQEALSVSYTLPNGSPHVVSIAEVLSK